jgi:squalene-hopene/tetraprenyl-beta-curcumene cyclase
LQRPDGGWEWPFRDTPPIKSREHYAVTMAAIAAGAAPDLYSATSAAEAGLRGIAKYLAATPPETLHEQAMVAWASALTPRLSSDDAKRETVARILAAQRPDGGWSLASLIENPASSAPASADAAAKFRSEPEHGESFLVYAGREAAYKTSLDSDGYATGLAIFVCRQVGVPANDERLSRGVAWLKTHQRASGRWFTPSQSWHSQNLIANAGTAYAVLALHSCGELAADEHPSPSP